MKIIKSNKIILFIMVLLPMQITFSQYQLPYSVSATNGNNLFSSNYQLAFTLGESIVGNTSASNNSLECGFWNIYKINVITSIEDKLLLPTEYKLYQNYPNPFNPSTKISWQSPVSSRQTLKVYDVLGNEVATLVDEYRDAGRYEVEFDASGLSSGVYFYKLTSGTFTETRKMIVIK